MSRSANHQAVIATVPAADIVAETSAQNGRPKVNTFDVFDTLIARRCIEPFRIFEMVAAYAKIENYVALRQSAEAAVADRPHNLDTIYAQLAAMLGLDAQRTAELKDLEIAFERQNAIPIAENLSQVADGDLLISDMYLGADIIWSLLNAAGFRKNVALIVTSDGKHSGRIWPQVLEKFEIKEHLGDNPHSDNLMPSRLAIANRHTAISSPNFVEKTLLDIGLRDLALICREARLGVSGHGHAHALQLLQASLNFPILVLASIALARLAKSQHFKSLLFCSRDCNLWLPLFRIVANRLGLACEIDYFYTSRLTRTKPSADYLNYAGAKIKDGTAVIDICGTGWSLAHLCQKLGLSDPHFVFLHRLPPVSLYEQVAPTPPVGTLHGLLNSTDERCNHIALEMSNYAEHGMAVDVRQIGEAFVPVFAQDERPVHIRDGIEAQRLCFMKATEILNAHGLRETLSLDEAALQVLCTALYQSLSNQTALQMAYAAQHHAEDIVTLKQLGCL